MRYLLIRVSIKSIIFKLTLIDRILGKQYSKRLWIDTRIRPRFFDQVGHETMSAFSRNKHFFTKSFHHQAYQNYEQPPQTSQNSYF